MSKITIQTSKAPAAIGPYSQAIRVNGFVYTSGQLGLDPETGELKDGVQEQTHQAFKNIQAILKEEGLDLNHIVKTTVFLNDMNDFAAVNEVYATYFSGSFPARSAVEVARLPKDGLVEIEAIAVV
jgi:2-iminobutanoate/2-iminopropanoate deaminase